MSTNAQVYPDGTTISRATAPASDKSRWEQRKEAKDSARSSSPPPQAQSAPLPDDVMAAKNAEAAKQAAQGSTKLDASAWPIVHGSVGMRDATAEHQPTTDTMALYSSQVVDGNDMNMAQMVMATMLSARNGGYENVAQRAASIMNFNLADSNPVSIITQKVSETSQLLWTSTIGNVLCYRQTDGKPDLERLAVLDHGLNFRFHGSYAMVASTDGKPGFFTTDDAYIVRFELQGSEGDWRIVETGRLGLPKEANPSGADALVGITLTDDGSVVVCSKQGVLMAAAVHSNGALSLVDVFPLQGHLKTPNSHVSNSIASKGQQVFIVTQRELVRVDLEPSTRKFNFGWASVYGKDEAWYVGRLGPGSGSTPSVTSCGGRTMVTITDGALPMSLWWFDGASGEVTGKRKVQFAKDENGDLPTTSEQSVAVDGCKAFVVQNYMGGDMLGPDIQCAVGAPFTELQAQLSTFCNKLDPSGGSSSDLFIPKACPSAFGCMSMGAALYELKFNDPAAPGVVERVWTRPDVSCGTSIPLVSSNPDSYNAYCVGARNGSSVWSLVGLDMVNGADTVSVPFYKEGGAKNFFANPFYAGVESVGKDKMAIGSIGGIIYLSPGKRTNNQATTTSPRLLGFLGEGIRATTASIGQRAGALDNGVKAAVISGFVAVVLLLFFVFRRRVCASPRLPMAGAAH